ncbi:MAG: hypothetical protein K9N35_10515 [Candidatus Marinimicrobia bacterium]|nr:hypothetical protein [Candidatus Neomarinimicrobiota bacterium]
MNPPTNKLDKYSWLDRLFKNPIPVMLKAAPLPIRYQVLRDIMGDEESGDFLALQKNLRKHESRRKLLSDQSAQGLWPIDGKLKGLDDEKVQTLQFIKQLETLHELLNLLVTSKQKKILLGMREVIRYLAENKLPLRIHYHTQAIYLAIAFNLDNNPIIKQLIWDILKRQNADGGWSSLPGESESCIWSSLFFLWTLGQSDSFHANRTLKKGMQYVETNLLTADQSHLLPGMQAWDTLTSGTHGLSILSGGTLRYLETVQLYSEGERSRKAEKRVDWLIGTQLKTALWPSIVNRDKQGDYAVTLRVLKILKHFENQRIIETMNYDDE